MEQDLWQYTMSEENLLNGEDQSIKKDGMKQKHSIPGICAYKFLCCFFLIWYNFNQVVTYNKPYVTPYQSMIWE